jgi:DNA polymerase III subunit epsilon
MQRHIIYYDTETTGVKPQNDKIIEIAAYNPITKKSFCEFVNPKTPIPQVITDITSITDDMVKDADSFEIVGQKFMDFCTPNAMLIAHNNDSFDKHFLINESKRHNITLPAFLFFDTLKWSRKYRPDLPKHSLQYLREAYNIEANNAHRALDDVMVLYKVFKQMKRDLNYEKAYDLLYNQASSEVTHMPFGKHRGKALNDIPKFYLKWLNESGALDKEDNADLKMSLEKQGLIKKD